MTDFNIFMRKHKHHKSNKPSENLSQKILNILRKQPTKGFKFPQIAEKLNANDTKTRNRIIRILGELTSKKKLVQTQSGQFQFNDTSNVFEGVVDMTNRGDAYIKVEDLHTDIYVPSKKLNTAFHKDNVEVYVANLKPHGRKSEGEVTKIIERNKIKFVGKIEINERFAFVVVQDPKMYTDIFIDKSDYNNAQDGQLVVVEMTKWQDNKDSPNGKVLEVLGTPGDHNTEMHAILAQYDLPEAFPKDVTNFANQLDTSINKKDIQLRRDMREVLTFTIDPATAKDFDDALSFRVLKNGNHEVGIHIADVSHYLQPDTILDEEAYNRATSIYLVDRVVPMLPEILSNDACSLRPNEDKLTFSAVFELGDNGQVIQQWFGRTVTHSDQRLAYEEAQYILDTQDTTVDQSVSLSGKSYQVSNDLKDAILKLNTLAEQMRHQRFQKGAISFDKVEVNFHLSEDNEPEGVYFKTSKAANKLIEEFMLLANKKVSEFIGKQKPPKTFVYRCHDEPSEDRLEALDKIISQFGYKLNYKSPKSLSQSINTLLKDVEGKNEQNLVDTLAIRSMSKAYYSTQNIGHYGLAFPYYSHFTSPIRRYPDVMVHRLLQHYLDGKPSQSEALYEDKCKHCSAMENLSTNAERDSIKFMQVKFMQKHEGDVFKGVISGVTDFGIFVELIENKCEGMIRLRDLPGDYYTFDPENYEVVGKKTGQSYRLGDEIDVKVKKADLIKRNLDFEMV